MRLIVALMVLCFAAGYSSEEVVSTTEEKPVVTTGDEGGNGEVATNDSLYGMVDRACSCGKGKGK